MKTTPTSLAQERKVTSHFGKHAGDWLAVYRGRDLNAVNIQLRKEFVLRFVDQLPLPKGAEALDLGCGTGLTTVDLLRRGFRARGVDIAPEMVEMAWKNCAEAGFAAGNVFSVGKAEELDFPDGTFDLVIAMGLIEYLTWDRWALQEMRRVLKPGGYLIVTAPNRVRLGFITNPRVLAAEVRRLLLPRASGASESRGTADLSEGAFQRRLYVPWKLDKMLETLGYEVVASVSHGFGPFIGFGRFPGVAVRMHWLLQRVSQRPFGALLRRLGNNYIAVCRRRQESPQVGQGVFFADVRAHVRDFRARHSSLFGARKRWEAAHPEYRSGKAQPIEDVVASAGPVLVVSPHPDDEVIGCGGTLLKMMKVGSQVTVLQLTDGSNAGALKGMPDDVRRTVRLEEATKVAREMKAELVLWREPDAHLECTDANVERMARLLADIHPTAVFVPFVNDAHPDHRAANRILSRGLVASALDLEKVTVLGYEVWSLVPANVWSEVDDELDAKVRLLLRYRTGMKGADYVSFCTRLAAYHGLTLLGKKGFAEAFFAIDAKRHAELVA